MTTSIKICGLTDAKTARQAVEMGADFLGVVLTKSRRQMSVTQAEEMLEAIPGIPVVGVGKDVDEPLFERMLELPLWGIQLHGQTPEDWVGRAHRHGKRALATWLDPKADIVLLDGSEPGSGRPRHWERPAWGQPLWLAGGLTPENVRGVVRDLDPEGVDVSSGVEVDGVKSVARIAQFIEEVRRGDNEKRA